MIGKSTLKRPANGQKATAWGTLKPAPRLASTSIMPSTKLRSKVRLFPLVLFYVWFQPQFVSFTLRAPRLWPRSGEANGGGAGEAGAVGGPGRGGKAAAKSKPDAAKPTRSRGRWQRFIVREWRWEHVLLINSIIFCLFDLLNKAVTLTPFRLWLVYAQAGVAMRRCGGWMRLPARTRNRSWYRLRGTDRASGPPIPVRFASSFHAPRQIPCRSTAARPNREANG